MYRLPSYNFKYYAKEFMSPNPNEKNVNTCYNCSRYGRVNYPIKYIKKQERSF